MSISLALLAALCWGAGDLLARLAAERVGTRATVFSTQSGSALLLSIWAVSTGALARPLAAGLLLQASCAAVLNAVGITLLYEALRRGPLTIVSPIASCFGAISAALAMLAGERPAPLQLIGLVAICIGVVGANVAPTAAGASERGGPLLAALAAICWGGAFFLLGPVFPALGVALPILIARIVAALGHALYALVCRQPLPSMRPAWLLLASAAVLDTGAFLAYGLSASAGLTTVASVVASLFSAVTIVLAWLVLRERVSPSQWAWVALLLVGIATLSLHS